MSKSREKKTLKSTIERAKKEIADLKAKLDSAKATGLCWEARRLLQLYAQGLTDWQQGASRKPWRQNYEEALQEYGAELSHPKTLSQKTLYMLGFMIAFRGYPDDKKQWESELEFWLLARKVAPRATEELLSDNEEKRKFLGSIDSVLAEPEEPAPISRGSLP